MAWEYKVTGAVTEAHMSILGREGWELVAITHSALTGFSGFYWKRALPSQPLSKSED